MTELLEFIVPIGVLQVILFCAAIWLLRWMLRINRAIDLLASIDESLKQLPAVRVHDHKNQRVNRTA